MAAGLLGGVQRQVLHQKRARPHPAHVAQNTFHRSGSTSRLLERGQGGCAFCVWQQAAGWPARVCHVGELHYLERLAMHAWAPRGNFGLTQSIWREVRGLLAGAAPLQRRCREAEGPPDQCDTPSRRKTFKKVIQRMRRSKPSECRRRYSASSATLSGMGNSSRPFTCAQPVSPGVSS